MRTTSRPRPRPPVYDDNFARRAKAALEQAKAKTREGNK